MTSAKQIVVKPISSKAARKVVEAVHYSEKTVNNSQVHMGVFLDGRCHGAMQFGPPLDKSKVLGLVAGKAWSEMIELNRMAFTDALPRNSESRAIAVANRMLCKKYPFLKWVLSFADGTQCGDGAIYRASGFLLTGIKTSKNLAKLPNGEVIHKLTLEGGGTGTPRPELGGRTYLDVTGGRYDFRAYCKAARATVLPGFQLRYIRLLKPGLKLTVPEIPFSKIAEMGASMYRGKKISALEA